MRGAPAVLFFLNQTFLQGTEGDLQRSDIRVTSQRHILVRFLYNHYCGVGDENNERFRLLNRRQVLGIERSLVSL